MRKFALLFVLFFFFHSEANYMKNLKKRTGFEDEYSWHQALLEETVQSLEKAGIPVAEADFAPIGGHVSIKFGKLSRIQFDRLVQDFNHTRILNQLPDLYVYSPDKEYFLKDFLEPRMRAVINKRLLYMVDDDVAKKLPGTDVLQTNCWSTAIDILNFSDPLMLNFVLWSDHDALMHLKNDDLTDNLAVEVGPVDQVMEKAMPRAVENPDDVLQPYDEFIVFNNSDFLSHVGLYLAHGLVFQMSGTVPELDNFQVSFLKKAFFQYTLLAQDFRIEYRRLKDGKSMPRPQDTISLTATGQENLVEKNLKGGLPLDHIIPVGSNYFERIFPVGLEKIDGKYQLENPYREKGLKKPTDI